MRFRFSLAAILLLLTCALAAVTAQDGVTRIPGPKDFGPDRCVAIATVYGDKTSHQQVYWNSAAKAFLLPVAPDTKSVKLVIMRVGYKTIRKEFQEPELSLNRYYKPKFEKLPETSLPVRLLDTEGKPAQGRGLYLAQYFDETEYLDDKGPESLGRNGLEVGRALTDKDGMATFKVPVAAPGETCQFDIAVNAQASDKHTYVLEQGYISGKSIYSEPVELKMVQLPTLSGKVEKSFLERNNVTASLGITESKPGDKRYRVEIMAESPVSGLFSLMGVEIDGSFKHTFNAGTYNLTMLVSGGDGIVQQSIPIVKGIILSNGEDKVVEVK